MPVLKVNPTESDPKATAHAVGLRYLGDEEPGITRKRTKAGFAFYDAHGKRITDADELARIKKLAVPPAYERVWISPDPRSHLQATGRDARGRKQYRYHVKWRELRDATKYHRMLEFGRALPKLRRHVDDAMGDRALSRERVLAVVLRLLDETLIRVGNDEYARTNHSYGLTTLLAKHVDVHGHTIHFAFRGKSGVDHDVKLRDARVAKALHACLELPGQELFHYIDHKGNRHAVGSHDVNEYLRSITGAEFTAKDYRTWSGSVLALNALRDKRFTSKTEAKRLLASTIKDVASRLRNTPAVCRKCYVHPAVIDTYVEGGLHEVRISPPRRHLRAEEATLLRFLEGQVPRA